MRRQSVFQTAASGTAPHARPNSTSTSNMKEELGNTEEIEVVAPATTTAPGTDSELHDQSGTGSTDTADDAVSLDGFDAAPDSPEPEEPTSTKAGEALRDPEAPVGNTVQPPSTSSSDTSAPHVATAANFDGSPSASAFATPTHPDEASYLDEPRRRRRWPLGIAAAALLLLGVIGAGGYAYAAHYDGHAVPGTTVAGTDVSGESRDEVVTTIENLAKNAKVDVSGDVTTSATLADLGTTVDAQATADAVMARGDTLGKKIQALVSKGEVPVVATTDKAIVDSYTSSLIPEDRAKARNATVVLSEDGVTFSITSASKGASLDTNVLAQAAQKAATSLSPSSVSLTMTNADPKVSDSDAQKVADKANSWVSQDITISAGEDSYTAEDTDKASWITVSNSADSAPTIAVDSAKVSQWVKEQADEANVEPVTGQRNINASGQVVSTPTEAKDGKTVSNADAVATSIAQSLGSDKAYSGTFETTTVKAEWKERTIADGAENLPYQAAPGEKWVDLNLSSKTVTAYEGATVVHGPVSIVDGAAETPTVTGTYKVYLQYESQTMRGENADGSPYVAEDVPWVSYFYSGYAFHGAGWRSSFGYSGSHGCVNMPVSEAQWIYNWVDTKTVVQSHY